MYTAAIFSVGFLMIGMVSGNSISVVPYYLSNRDGYRKTVLIDEIISIVIFLTFLFIFITDIGIYRFLNNLISPTPYSITHYIFFILIGSLFIHIILFISISKQQLHKVLTNLFVIVSILWSIEVVFILTVFQEFFIGDSTLAFIFGDASFVLVSLIGGLLLLLCTCKIVDLISKSKCSIVSLKKLRN